MLVLSGVQNSLPTHVCCVCLLDRLHICPIHFSRQNHYILPQPSYQYLYREDSMFVLSGFQNGHRPRLCRVCFFDPLHFSKPISACKKFDEKDTCLVSLVSKIHQHGWRCVVWFLERLHICVQYFVLSLYQLFSSAIKKHFDAIDVCFSGPQNPNSVCRCWVCSPDCAYIHSKPFLTPNQPCFFQLLNRTQQPSMFVFLESKS